MAAFLLIPTRVCSWLLPSLIRAASQLRSQESEACLCLNDAAAHVAPDPTLFVTCTDCCIVLGFVECWELQTLTLWTRHALKFPSPPNICSSNNSSDHIKHRKSTIHIGCRFQRICSQYDRLRRVSPRFARFLSRFEKACKEFSLKMSERVAEAPPGGPLTLRRAPLLPRNVECKFLRYGQKLQWRVNG